MSSGDGICHSLVEEDHEAIHVRVILCREPDNEDDDRRCMDCPVHVYLEEPLSGRAVIDVDSAAELPLYVPGCEPSDTGASTS